MSNSYTLNELDFFKICRICMSTGEMKPLYDDCETELCLLEKLMQCTFVEFFYNDGLPTQICEKCIAEIDRSYKFALKCEESDQKLRNHLQELVKRTKEIDHYFHEYTFKKQTKKKFKKYNIKDAIKIVKKSKSKSKHVPITYNKEQICDIEYEIRDFSNIDNMLKNPKKYKNTKEKRLIDDPDLNNRIKQGFVDHEIDFVSNDLEVSYGSKIMNRDLLYLDIVDNALPINIRESPGFLSNTKQELNKKQRTSVLRNGNTNAPSTHEECEVSHKLTILNKDMLVNTLSENLLADPLQIQENQNESTFKNNLNQHASTKLLTTFIQNAPTRLQTQSKQNTPTELQTEQIKNQNAHLILQTQHLQTDLEINKLLNIPEENLNFTIIELQSTSNQPEVGQQLTILPQHLLLSNEINTPANSIKFESTQNEIENKIDPLEITNILNLPIKHQSHENVKQFLDVGEHSYELGLQKAETVSEIIKDNALEMECSNMKTEQLSIIATLDATQIQSGVSEELKMESPQKSLDDLISRNQCQIRLKPMSELISNQTLKAASNVRFYPTNTSNSYLMSTANNMAPKPRQYGRATIKKPYVREELAKNINPDAQTKPTIPLNSYRKQVTKYESPNPPLSINKTIKTYKNKKLISQQNNIYNDINTIINQSVVELNQNQANVIDNYEQIANNVYSAPTQLNVKNCQRKLSNIETLKASGNTAGSQSNKLSLTTTNDQSKLSNIETIKTNTDTSDAESNKASSNLENSQRELLNISTLITNLTENIKSSYQRKLPHVKSLKTNMNTSETSKICLNSQRKLLNIESLKININTKLSNIITSNYQSKLSNSTKLNSEIFNNSNNQTKLASNNTSDQNELSNMIEPLNKTEVNNQVSYDSKNSENYQNSTTDINYKNKLSNQNKIDLNIINCKILTDTSNNINYKIKLSTNEISKDGAKNNNKKRKREPKTGGRKTAKKPNKNIQANVKTKGPYECTRCNIKFPIYILLRDHYRKVSHRQGLRQCPICSKWLSAKYYKKHLKNVHTNERYKCDKCNKQFTSKTNCYRHQKTHGPEKPYKCDICHKGYSQSTNLSDHRRLHTGETPFTCEICGKSFSSSIHFKSHKYIHIDERKNGAARSNPLKCNICFKVLKTPLGYKYHALVHKDKEVLCSVCGLLFRTELNLRVHHNAMHTNERPYACQVCNKAFKSTASLYTHKLIHSSVYRFKCSVCYRGFRQQQQLVGHMRTHTGERPYRCHICGKAFKLGGVLKVHIRTHTGEQPYTCSVCNKGFYDSSSMKKHRSKHKEFKNG